MEVEIARYPIRCHRCGATDQVRVVVADMCGDEEPFRSQGVLPTERVAPDGWTWERDADGQPRWVCPACLKSKPQCESCAWCRSSYQDGSLVCDLKGQETWGNSVCNKWEGR